MVIYESMYLTDTSENVLNTEIEESDEFEIRGTLFLDIDHDRANFSSAKYNIELQDIGITILEENKSKVIVVISEYDDVGEWVFEHIYSEEVNTDER